MKGTMKEREILCKKKGREVKFEKVIIRQRRSNLLKPVKVFARQTNKMPLERFSFLSYRLNTFEFLIN